MNRLRPIAIGFIFLSALAAALFGINYLGVTLKRQAVNSWLEKANDESQRITDISLGWLSLFQAQLRGVASLFFGSENVTENEFLNALDLVEGVELEAMIPLTSTAYAEQRMSGRPAPHGSVRESLFPVMLSSDISPPLAVGQDLAAHPQINSAILSALDHPEKVIMGPVFEGGQGKLFTCFAIRSANNGKPGVLVSVADLSDFLTDLAILYIPEGLNLRILEHEHSSGTISRWVITGDREPHPEAVATAFFPTQSGQAHWDYYWDVLPTYQGGAETILGTVVQFGGNALVLAVFAIVATLLLQNERINRQVSRRTEELVVATRAAEAANRAKSIFLANMSHELRTPLNSVLGFSRLLVNDPEITVPQKQSLNLITRSGEHLLNLINNVLEISKIESGRVELEMAAVDLHHLLLEIQTLMRVRAQEKGLSFTLEQESHLPRHIVVDSGKLRQILINLTDNAIKYTRQGNVILRAGVMEPLNQERLRLRFEVEDSGRGIDQKHREGIFIPFVQLTDRSASNAGSGLGLAICKQYVDLMGGQISVRSKAGIGSVFRIEIQAVIPPSGSFAAESKHGRVIGVAPGQPRYRLLIVEDQPENRLLLRRILEPRGFEMREAENGQEALTHFEQWQPHLIWMDIRMPVMDGLEATRRIKATEAGGHTKIIALTAHALEEERVRILSAGCDDFIRKPYRSSEIFESLTKHLGVHFIYADESGAAQESIPPDTAALASLPDSLVSELEQVLLRLDTEAINAVIQRIRRRHEELGAGLTTLAKAFQYGKILRMIEDYRSDKKSEERA
jgi:signal transduction histidine kinase/DNA-binding NarL/FixJ family response regulator